MSCMSAQFVSPLGLCKLAYSIAEAEVMTSLSRATLARAIARNELGSIKRGRRRLIPEAELREFLQRKEGLSGC
jgi:excisionase family DNA binding protein